jgi:hypothetical protein
MNRAWPIRLRLLLLLPFDCRWNAWVRDATAWLERHARPGVSAHGDIKEGKMSTERSILNMPDPTEEQLASPEFEAVWQAIKSWDVRVPEFYDGYCGANGSHVVLILNALDEAPGA